MRSRYRPNACPVCHLYIYLHLPTDCGTRVPNVSSASRCFPTALHATNPVWL